MIGRQALVAALLCASGCGSEPPAPAPARQAQQSSPLERALREVPPVLRAVHQRAQECARDQASKEGRRWVATPATVRAITARLRRNASDTGCASGGGDPASEAPDGNTAG